MKFIKQIAVACVFASALSTISVNAEIPYIPGLYEWFKPSNNDPRLTGLVATGAAATILGLYTTTKGLQKFFMGPEKNSSLLRHVATRVGGLAIAPVGAALAIAGVSTMLFPKEMINYIDYSAFWAKHSS